MLMLHLKMSPRGATDQIDGKVQTDGQTRTRTSECRIRAGNCFRAQPIERLLTGKLPLESTTPAADIDPKPY
jgi:hypothetical protein